jgi:hypothetical protein
MTDLSFTFLSVRMFAAGTVLRTGVEPDDFTPIEELSAGEAIYDPVSGRFHDILEMSCRTLDREKARARGMEVYRLAPSLTNRAVTCMIESRDMSLGRLRAHPPQSGGETGEGVFYGLSFDARVVVDTGAALCEIR